MTPRSDWGPLTAYVGDTQEIVVARGLPPADLCKGDQIAIARWEGQGPGGSDVFVVELVRNIPNGEDLRDGR